MNFKIETLAQVYAEAFLGTILLYPIDMIIYDLKCVSSTVSSSLELKIFLYNSLICTQSKKNVLTHLFSGVLKDETLRFLMLLCDKRRISYLTIFIEKIIFLIYKKISTEIVTVESTVQLTSLQKEILVHSLKKNIWG